MMRVITILFSFIIVFTAQAEESAAVEHQPPTYLYKILSEEPWRESLLNNSVIKLPIDTDFIHLAKEEQIEQVASKFWQGQNYILLKLESKKLPGKLILETNPGGKTEYYHLYEATIPIEAIVEARNIPIKQ